jgi:hypothetical protein
MDAHEREYQAAVGGMADLYGELPDASEPHPLPSVGDWVNGIARGQRFSGYVQQVEPGRVVVETHRSWISVKPEELAVRPDEIGGF